MGCCQSRGKKYSDEPQYTEVEINNKDIAIITSQVQTKPDETHSLQKKFFNSNLNSNDKFFVAEDNHNFMLTFNNLETDKNNEKRDSNYNIKEIHLADQENITNISFQKKDFDSSLSNMKQFDQGNFELYIKINSFVVLCQELTNLFKVELDPVLYICFDDSLSEVNLIKDSRDLGNKNKEYTCTDKNYIFLLKKTINNEYKNVIFSIFQMKEKNDQSVDFCIGDITIPLNLLINHISVISDKVLSIPIYSRLEGILIGNLSIECLSNVEISNENIKKSNNVEFASFMKEKFENYSKHQIMSYFDIDHKLRNEFFNEYENLLQMSFKNIEFSINNEESIFDMYREISDPIKNLILLGKLDELRKYIIIPNTNKHDHLEVYVMLYILIEMINNNAIDKVNSDLFYQTFLYQILENKSEELNNIILLDILLKFYVKIKEKNLVKAEYKYHMINLDKLAHSLKDVFERIVKYLRSVYQSNVHKRFMISDPIFYYYKSALYNFFLIIKLILKDDYDFDKINSQNEEKSKHRNSKGKLDENILRIVEKDINFFKKNFKEFLIIEDEYLVKDSNILLLINKCYYAYFKLAKKFSKIKSVSRSSLVYEVFLVDCEVINWLKKNYFKFNNKKFFVDLLEISLELIDECSINCYIYNFLTCFGVFFLKKSFSQYKEKLCTDNYKIWLYYSTILNKISSLVKLDKLQFLDKFTLSNNETVMILIETIEMCSILEENKIFTSSKLNSKFLEVQICLQIQFLLVEILKNIIRNKSFIMTFLIKKEIINNNKVIVTMRRLLNLLCFDKSKIKPEYSSLFNSITFNCFFIMYYLIRDDEILNKFIKSNLSKLCECDFEGLKRILLLELEIIKTGPNKYIKFDQINEEINNKN